MWILAFSRKLPPYLPNSLVATVFVCSTVGRQLRAVADATPCQNEFATCGVDSDMRSSKELLAIRR